MCLISCTQNVHKMSSQGDFLAETYLNNDVYQFVTLNMAIDHQFTGKQTLF